MDIELGSVIAYRTWRPILVNGSTPRLIGSFTTIWPYGEIKARCVMDSHHDAPKYECTCGIYGVKNEALTITAGLCFQLLGQVELYGKVIEHEYGYRAEYGHVFSIRDLVKCAVCNIPLFIDRLEAYGILQPVHLTSRDMDINLIGHIQTMICPECLDSLESTYGKIGTFKREIWCGTSYVHMAYYSRIAKPEEIRNTLKVLRQLYTKEL